MPKDDKSETGPMPDSDAGGSIKDKTVAAARKARDKVSTAKTAAKETAVEAFDKVIESLDSLGEKRN